MIGGGILGSSIAYFLGLSTKCSIAVVEQERNFGMHASGRNTGRVHAPFLYHPEKRRLTARAALKGYDMLKEYCSHNDIPFTADGVMEVATSEEDTKVLDRYLDWGHKNGLTESELNYLSSDEVRRIEPNVRCNSAIICNRDASTDYGLVTKKLIKDAQKFGCHLVTNSKIAKFSRIDRAPITLVKDTGENFSADYIVNAAGGNSLNIAKAMGLAKEYDCLYFRGEYWTAPREYFDLTSMSIYSVPKYLEYPFLDPHWILRVDGSREIGPNAVPVFSPYSYDWKINLKNSLPKIIESSTNLAILRLFRKSEFLLLSSREFLSSFSKKVMINRVRRFLPSLKPSAFIERGASGVRSSLINKRGEFVPEMLTVENNYSLHILNYNSPGATGALPIAAKVVSGLIKRGYLKSTNENAPHWDVNEISDSI